jgi:hypothetical protein
MTKQFNFGDKLLHVQNFVSDKLLHKIQSFPYKIVTDSYSEWEKLLNINYEKVLVSEKLYHLKSVKGEREEHFKDDIFKEVADKILKGNYVPLWNDNISVSINYYRWPKYSGITWHGDGDYTISASFYIHKKWEKTFGGETLFEVDQFPYAIDPMTNSITFVKNNVEHKVCAILSDIPRESLQIRVAHIGE